MIPSWVILVVLAAFIYTIHLGYNDPTPRAASQRPAEASSDAEWLLLPFQLVGGLAALLWCLLGLLVFLAPLLFVAAVVWGALQ